MKVVYIHGHKSDQSCWEHIKAGVEGEAIFLNYDSNNGFDANLKEMNIFLRNLGHKNEDIFFIGHSLGGIYARVLAKEYENVCVGGVSISTPHGGCELAHGLKMFDPNNPVFNDVHPFSPVIMSARYIDLDIDWLNIVTTDGGNPLWILPNDGVVSVFSQSCLNHKMRFLIVNKNHFNILEWELLPSIINSEVNKGI
ncbi:hypothetical protein UFOVP58_27 [uncultured Caudovirales phage]|uniref:Uncharacterized protein n=1 Tax=uncultured Caudovirales phage TaxID=2100421 RepID=A0A6J5KUF3_9CAUD|nr:hypothetical protein UFOVP58_27 [uncultured Caudovirales phage]